MFGYHHLSPTSLAELCIINIRPVVTHRVWSRRDSNENHDLTFTGQHHRIAVTSCVCWDSVAHCWFFYRTCLIYGALPPETRRQQAKLFNEADNDYNVLVASDAVGMGLNLNIRRIVFTTLYKVIDNERHIISTSEIKQIAGENLICDQRKSAQALLWLFVVLRDCPEVQPKPFIEIITHRVV